MSTEPAAIDVYTDGLSFEIVAKGQPPRMGLPAASVSGREMVRRYLGCKSLETYFAASNAMGRA